MSLRVSVDTQAVVPSRAPKMAVISGNEREVIGSILLGRCEARGEVG